MPQMANLTLKNADGVDVTATAITASAGDQSPARWRVEFADVPPLYRPTFTLTATESKDKATRRVTVQGRFPVAVFANNEWKPQGYIPFVFEMTVPQGLASSNSANLVAFATSFLNSELVKASMLSQTAPV